jgi:phosphoglycolate phosphatase
MKKGILFDLDGTLWDSSKEVADSWMEALTMLPDVNVRITTKDIQAVMGLTMDEIARRLFPGESPQRQMELLEHCVTIENQYIERHGGHLFEGLEVTLRQLKAEYNLFIVSNCQTGYIEAFLKHHQLGELFDDFECYGNTKQSKGENIKTICRRNQLTKAIYVGDTQGDYEAAMAAGLPFIHARTGYGEVTADVPFITSLSQLTQILSELI